MSTQITIRDVAARAGCSIATVSRVVTGNGPVSEEMRRRVVEAALTVGFPLARAFPETRPVISILVPSLTNPVFAAAVAGIEQRARTAGMFTILGQSNYDPAQEEDIVTTLIGERPVGMIMTVCDPASSVALHRVRKAGLPVVTIYNEDTPEGVAAVMVDNRSAIRRAAEDLIALGHRRILFLAGKFISSDRSARRYEGYRDAMAAAGLTAAPAIEVDFIDATRDIDLTEVLVEYRPTAIMASNDLLAFTVIASLRRAGLSVPEDVSVTGFDGIDFARLISPKLHTIQQPSQVMGTLAASLLLDMAAGHKAPQRLCPDAIPLPGETIAPPRRGEPPLTLIPTEKRKLRQ
ncbi:substrate-binding domain-containing protein [Mesorhizobium sp. VK22B]|uniref:Substrate-binding domain-containing protein n=1 Tax=Mesorhizobium captivum TaxID=3072319 RepID=A0ABU4YZX9_9HYPH|nr:MULTISPECIES: substrate-binding domain-containing protein [unclassified Mesorhizobium]MDX8492484.1 substrate-binding domain-containing protein [Mesorhizobium sp. VK22B]MDX8505573.1 substrate-binding domain-containing protein [Mesorhizobium sp. VK22E]